MCFTITIRLSCRLEFLCTCVVFVAALFCVIERDNIDAGSAGLSLTYALSLTGILNWLVRQSSEGRTHSNTNRMMLTIAIVETQIVAVERVNEYTELSEEGPYLMPGSK